MNIHAVYQVPFEGLGYINDWIRERGHGLTETHAYDEKPFPETGDFDMLIIMGGPMNVYEDHLYPWLQDEKDLIRKAIGKGKMVLGICLGAQLIALALGSKVFRNKKPEIGWFPVHLDNSLTSGIFHPHGTPMVTFHWHGDAFDLPEESQRLAFSDATANQAFLFEERVLGIQFHPEVRSRDIRQMIQGAGTGLKKDDFVQTADEMMAVTDFFRMNHVLLGSWLDWLVKKQMPN